MKFEFGMVVGMDFVPSLRVMMTAPVVGVRSRPDNWWGIVLRDESPIGLSWPVGKLITLSPQNAGLTIIDTPEGSE